MRLDTAALVARSLALGADLAGVAAIDDLRDGPSAQSGLPDVSWPEGARSILVVAVAHPAERPELDWWLGRSDPPGNRLLAGVVQKLCDQLVQKFEMHPTHLPYHVERGGAYLKDAAILAGLGCIGRNNLLVTPRYGPRVRLRALTVDTALASTGPSDFDPCSACDAPCRSACPQGAFAISPPTAPPARTEQPAVPRRMTSTAGLRLPARDGAFSRSTCYVQMDLDVNSAAPLEDSQTGGGLAPDGPAVKVIRYCRACELSCPVGL